MCREGGEEGGKAVEMGKKNKEKREFVGVDEEGDDIGGESGRSGDIGKPDGGVVNEA